MAIASLYLHYIMLTNTSMIMEIMVWIINDIHMEFNDIHWEGCLHIRTLKFVTSGYVQTSLLMNIIKLLPTPMEQHVLEQRVLKTNNPYLLLSFSCMLQSCPIPRDGLI